MKKPLFLLLLCLIVIDLSAQQNKNAPKHNTQSFGLHQKKLFKEGVNFATLQPKTHGPEMNRPSNRPLKNRSVIWEPDTVVIYDSLGLIHRYTYTYNTNGDMLTWILEDRQTNTWVIVNKYTYTYDGNGKRLTELDQSFEDPTWYDDYRFAYTYDGNGNLITELGQYFLDPAWSDDTKITYTYDGNGNMTSKIGQDWSGVAWVNFYNDIYTYDGNGNKLTDITSFWQGTVWENGFTYIWTYDGNNNMLTELDEVWDVSEWVFDSRYTYTYNGNNYLTAMSLDYWAGASWDPGWRHTYTNDGNGNRLTEISELWNTDDLIWENSYRCAWTYDAHGNSITGNAENWQNNSWHPSEDNDLYVFSNRKNLMILNGYRYEINYKLFTGIDDLQAVNNRILLYPNPANDFITIENLELNINSSVSVYNMQGQILLYQPINEPKTQINISSLTKGMYLLKIMNERDSYIKRFVKQ